MPTTAYMRNCELKENRERKRDGGTIEYRDNNYYLDFSEIILYTLIHITITRRNFMFEINSNNNTHF
jgi:hypothetical protein